MTGEQSREWHLDRKFSIGLLLAIIGQTGGAIWWAATVSSTVAELRATDQKHEVTLQSLTTGRESNANRITTLEATVTGIGTHLDRIENKLDRLIEAKREP